ncbi:hypothetical protein [Nonomuraea sp. NPDC005650]|uniref:hypothetical protein n=1 Tax=Nonomuraea sp. NPDC005650 TaxID=3157045 RepID=UPI0033AA5752
MPEVYQQTYEPLETLSYVAALTERVKLGTSIIDAPAASGHRSGQALRHRFATASPPSTGSAAGGSSPGSARGSSCWCLSVHEGA